MKGNLFWLIFLVRFWRFCNGNDDDMFHGMIDLVGGEGDGEEDVSEEEMEVPFDPTTRNNFNVFKNSLPQHLLTVPLQSQEVLLDLVDLYLQEKNKILPYEIFHERENRVSSHSSLVTDVNIAVIFIGFPASSISRMKELWFEKLRRSDHLQGLLSSTFEEILHTPSRLQIQHQFHVIDTSFHLDSAIVSFLNAIALRKSSTSPHFYLNAWEVDDLLTSLKDTLFDSTTATNGEREIKPDLTFCILNLDLLQGRNSSAILPHYSYRNGFSYEDMTRMKESDSIRSAAGQVVRMISHKSRMIVDGLESKLSLSGGDLPTAPSGNEKMKLHTDKIRASKKWATALQEKVEKMKEVAFEQRILSILSNDKRSPVFESYRHILAREILSNEMQTSFDESSSQSFQRRHGVDSCETDLWTGGNGVIWLDVRATEGRLSLTLIVSPLPSPVCQFLLSRSQEHLTLPTPINHSIITISSERAVPRATQGQSIALRTVSTSTPRSSTPSNCTTLIALSCSLISLRPALQSELFTTSRPLPRRTSVSFISNKFSTKSTP
jgi:hypothetical protein